MYSLGGLLVDRLEFSEVVDDMIGPMLQKSGARVIAIGHATCGATCIASHLNVKRDNYYQLLTKEYKLCNSALNEKDKSRHLNSNIT